MDFGGVSWLMTGSGLAGAAAAAGGAAFCRAVFMPRSQMCGRVLFRGPRADPPRIALTFDDGPDPAGTPRVLEILRRHRVRAAFLVVGRHAAAHADLVRRIDAEGHLVGNHSFEHAHLGSMRRGRYWDAEIERTDALIEGLIGKRPALFRPPMGFKTFHMARAAARQGHAMVTWTRRAYDGMRRTRPDLIIARLARAEPGDIVLMHDGAVRPFRIDPHAAAQALDALLPLWKARNLVIQRLDELLGVPGYNNTSASISAAASGPAAARAGARRGGCRARVGSG